MHRDGSLNRHSSIRMQRFGRQNSYAETPRMKREREALRKRFEPIFEPYQEEGGMPIKTFKKDVIDKDLTHDIPQEKLSRILRDADLNGDKRLSYPEFEGMMTSGGDRIFTVQPLTCCQKFSRFMVACAAAPKGRQKDQLDSYMDAYNCCPPPLFMIIASIVEVIVFCYYAFTCCPTTATSGAPIKSELVYNPYKRFQPWRYLTYMLIHNGYLHLIFNLCFQLMLGIPLEIVHKFWRVGIVYSLGVIAGSMSHSVTDPSSFLAGASGGCYAILGAHFAIVIMNWEEMNHEWLKGPWRFLLSAPVRLVVLFLIGGSDTGIAIYNRYKTGKSAVGFAAHFGGFLAGVLIGIPVLKNLEVKPWEKVLFWISLIIYLLLLTFAVLWSAFYPGYPAQLWGWPWDPSPTIIPN